MPKGLTVSLNFYTIKLGIAAITKPFPVFYLFTEKEYLIFIFDI